MLALRISFIALTLASIGCMVIGAWYKRRNPGFVITAAIITASDCACVALMSVQNASMASKVLLPYYVLHAWMLFAIILMISRIDKYRYSLVCIILSAVASLYQTYLVISQYFGARIFSFQKRIYFRRAWFVATDTKFTGLLFSYRSYRIMVYFNMLLALIVIGACMAYSSRMFRIRYVSLAAIMAAFAVIEGIAIRFALPIWIPCMAYSLFDVVFLYLTTFFARGRLREWSLDSFANDMSDGLILYDKYDDLIHVNDMIRNTLTEDLVEEFADRSRLEAWISDTGEVENNAEIVTYQGRDREYYFKMNVRDISEHGKRIGTLFILHDTTDSITRIRAMQRANEELERANRMKSDFLANMSHEIRTPMNAVIGMTEIAMREEKSPEVMDYLTQISHSGNHLLNIINDILDYSKIESGKMEIVEEDYVPFDELSEVAGILATRTGDKNLRLCFLADGPMPRRLRGDVQRIRQVLINLANNAIKFTNEGSVRVRLSFEPAGEGMVNCAVHVIDTGIGIKPEDLDKLFVSFQQVDSKRNRSVEGTGLGLAISQRLVEAMGGRIGVDSEYGRGSDFWFILPQGIVDGENDQRVVNADGTGEIMLNDLLAEARPREEEKFRIDFTAPDARVLVVDDNHINLTIAEGLLAPIKVQIDTADGGQQAIDKAAANDYDIIFMDHMMPEIDGVDATRTIRAAGDDDPNHPVIIALSANAMTEARSLFLDAGMNDFVPKPIDVKDLITKVKKWLPDDKIMENDGTEADPGSEYGTDENWIRCEGLDVETAVRALGSTALYDKIASEYYRSGAEKHDGIMAAYANEDWNDYTIRVHALKSSSRQIGAMELGSMAEAMEKAGKAGDIDAIRAGNSQTMVKFLKLLSDLSEYYGVEEDDSDKSPIEAEVLGGMLDELAAACDDLDMDGMESVSDRLKQYSYDEDVRPVIDDLLKAIGDMDTDACMEIADKLR